MGGKRRGNSTLFGDDDDEDANNTPVGQNNLDNSFKINTNYAQNYDRWRNKEEVMKVKARYGVDRVEDAEVSSDSSSSEDEDWTTDKEKAFFKTLASLKAKNPKIYDPNTKFFNPNNPLGQGSAGPIPSTSKGKGNKKEDRKPFLLKDHEREMILNKGALLSSSDEDDEVGKVNQRRKKTEKQQGQSYYEQQDDIKKGFSDALKNIESDNEDDAESDKLLRKRKPKSAEEEEKDEQDYRKWLKGELEKLEGGKTSKEEQKELGFLRSYWNDDKLDEGEKFLRDYLLNQKYLEPTKDKDHVPSYEEVLKGSDSEPEAEDLSDEENFETKQEEFEHKYNFRFEEPDPEFIKRFPRTIQDSLRREDERRKKQREVTKERKSDVKERKREEIQRLKAYKRKEIMDKLKQLQEISGGADLPLDDLDIDGDFDPAEYDRKMEKVFNERYYQESDDVKPEFPYDPEIDDEVDWDKWVPEGEEGLSSEQDEEDEESNPTKKKIVKKEKSESGKKSKEASRSKKRQSFAQELIEASKGKGDRTKKSMFVEVIEKEKPKFDPKVHKSFAKYFEEYYSLDFEDLVGDLPCRFKYRKVTPNDFGLSIDEILKAPDRELNQWASLKKTYQYRAEDEEMYEAQAYKKKAENSKLKKRVLLSVYKSKAADASEEDTDSEAESPNSKPLLVNVKSEDVQASEPEEAKKSKKKKKKKKRKSKSGSATQEDEEDGNRKIKTEPSEAIQEEVITSTSTEPIQQSAEEVTPKKKSKKKKSTKGLEEVEDSSVNSKFKDRSSASYSNPSEGNPSSSKKSKQRHQGTKRKATEIVIQNTVEDDRLKAYGLNPKKHKKWMKYGGGAKQ